MKSINQSVVLKEAFQDSVPVFFGYLPLGIVFGLLFFQHGYPWYLAPLMSLLTYAGTTQLIAINLIANQIPLFSLFLAVVVIDMRHIFYSISLISRFPAHWTKKWYLAHGLTDETYSILTSKPKKSEHDYEYCIYLTLLNHAYWVGGTLIGVLFGVLVPFQIPGLRFVLTALFLVLLVEQWLVMNTKYPFLVGLLAGSVAIFIRPKQMLLIAIVLSVLTLAARKEKPCPT